MCWSQQSGSEDASSVSLNVLAFLTHVLFNGSHLALCREVVPSGAGGDYMWHSRIRGVSITPQLSSSSSVFSSLKSVPQDFGTGQCPSSTYVGFQLYRPPLPSPAGALPSHLWTCFPGGSWEAGGPFCPLSRTGSPPSSHSFPFSLGGMVSQER